VDYLLTYYSTPVSIMRTLFSENILSPSPIPTPQPNPFEQLFPATSSTAGSTTSTQSSPSQNDRLTRYSQDQPRASGEIQDEASCYNANAQRAQYVRRRGNPKLLFMGLRRYSFTERKRVCYAIANNTLRSGKSSIQKVVFQKLSPADTLFLEPTTAPSTATMQSFVTFESTELPSHLSLHAPDVDHASLFAHAGAVIWILDVQDEYLTSISAMVRTAVFLATHHPRVHFEVFIHKTDGLSEEYRYETFREVRQRAQDELSDLGQADRRVAYYQTSIFDASVFEAMSKVVQKLLPQLPALEALLNKLCSACRIQKAYLFDTVSKIYIATDASPTFLRDYEVCSDYVDVVVDIKQIYGWRQKDRQGEASGGDDDKAEEEERGLGGSVVTYDRSGDTYIYAREING